MYPDIDYINDMLYYINELSYHLRKRKSLNYDIAQQMISLTIDLLNILEIYIEDKYDY